MDAFLASLILNYSLFSHTFTLRFFTFGLSLHISIYLSLRQFPINSSAVPWVQFQCFL